MSTVCHLLARRPGEPDLQEGLGGGGGVVHLGWRRQRDQNPSQPHQSLNKRLQEPWGELGEEPPPTMSAQRDSSKEGAAQRESAGAMSKRREDWKSSSQMTYRRSKRQKGKEGTEHHSS